MSKNGADQLLQKIEKAIEYCEIEFDMGVAELLGVVTIAQLNLYQIMCYAENMKRGLEKHEDQDSQ